MTLLKRTSAVLSILLICLSTLSSQTWYYDYFEDGSMEDICPISSGQWLAISALGNEETSLLKLDENGLIIGQRELFSGACCLGSRLVNAGNQFAYYLSHATVRINGSSIDKPLFVFDMEGKELLQTSLPTDLKTLSHVIGHDDGTISILFKSTNAEIIILRMDSSGNELWRNNWGADYIAQINGGNQYFQGMGLIEMDSGDIIYYGLDEARDGTGGSFFYYRINSLGQTLVDNRDSLNAITMDESEYILCPGFIAHDGNPVFTFSRHDGRPYKIELLLTDENGNLLKTDTISLAHSNTAHIIHSGSPDEYFILGSESMIKLDEDFSLIWEKELPLLISGDRRTPQISHSSTKALKYTQGFTVCGRQFNGMPNHSYAAKIDTGSILETSRIEGICYYDENANCRFDRSEKTANNKLIAANLSGSNIGYGISKNGGQYAIELFPNNYKVIPTPPSPYHEVCPDTATVNIGQSGLTITQNFGFITTLECPYLHVKVLNTRLRQCVENVYQIEYWNSGTAIAEDAFIELELDPFLTLISATIPHNHLQGNLYSFQLGDLEIEQRGSFEIIAFLDCDSTTLGQTHCVAAHIYPDSICEVDPPDWEGSTISVSGVCQGDSVRFQIENNGENMLESKNYFIVEDDIILMMEKFKLDKDAIQDIAVEATGKTLRIIAEQSSSHPGFSNPTAVVELCDDPDGSLGFVNDFPPDDENNFIDIHCAPSRNSYDPNDKAATPTGVKAENFIDPDRTIEYQIRFQNTGNDTAYIVILHDSIDQNLDLSTLQVNGGSHNYEVNISGENLLVFTFNNIYLPDSTTNPMASQGFVNYSIKPIKRIEKGEVITNDVDIYFDFNKPIRTNEVFHTIGLGEILTSINLISKELLELTVYPNPSPSNGEVHLDGFADKISNGKIQIINHLGQLVQSSYLNNGKVNLSKSQFTQGLYTIIVLDQHGNIVASEKLIIHH